MKLTATSAMRAAAAAGKPTSAAPKAWIQAQPQLRKKAAAAPPAKPPPAKAKEPTALDNRRRTRRILRKRWPSLFGYGPLVPLAVGIRLEIRAAISPDEITMTQLRRFFDGWCNGPKYKAACARPGARRRHLDGSDAGPAEIEPPAAAVEVLEEAAA
jgi:hypothetical protein